GFMLLAFIIIWFYPLTDNKFKEIVQEIDKRKQSQQQLIKDFNMICRPDKTPASPSGNK
ncbi:hypothetical protein MJL79_30110, partial [Salmonella enterica subsp. enterica serovar Montevideo]|nr:hypothetical protein [Salmonella enterica subsp. enterica serovar Montevideo]